MNNNSNIFRPPSCHKVQTPQFAKEQQQPKNAKGNNRQVFRIQTFKLSPNFKNNLSQMPSTQDTLEQRLADQTSEIKLLQNQIAELKKQNELLEQRLRKANSTVSDYWIKVKDIEVQIFFFQIAYLNCFIHQYYKLINFVLVFVFKHQLLLNFNDVQQLVNNNIQIKNWITKINQHIQKEILLKQYINQTPAGVKQISKQQRQEKNVQKENNRCFELLLWQIHRCLMQNAPFLQLEELRQILLQLGMHESIVQEMQYLSQQAQNQLNVNIDNMTYEQILNLQERIGHQNVGLTKLQIKEIPKRTKEAHDNVEEMIWNYILILYMNSCTVCYDPIQTGNVYRQLPCNHIYHSKCIKAWLLNHKKCPVCNIEVILGSEQHEDHNHQQTQ